MFDKIKNIYKVMQLFSQIKEGTMDFKSIAGWIKIVGYLFAGLSLVSGYVSPQNVLAFTIFLSALIKIADIIAPLTKTTKDDEIVKAVKDEAKEHGFYKD